MTTYSTDYGEISESLFEHFNNCKLLVCDVDGVFSDGRIYLGNDGEELKAFHTRDGYGVKALLAMEIEVAVITGRNSQIVQQRMEALGVAHILQGTEQKAIALQELQNKLGVTMSETIAIGDDIPDLGMFDNAQVGVAVSDAHPTVIKFSQYVTQKLGGFGAVREIADLILHAKNSLHSVESSSV